MPFCFLHRRRADAEFVTGKMVVDRLLVVCYIVTLKTILDGFLRGVKQCWGGTVGKSRSTRRVGTVDQYDHLYQLTIDRIQALRRQAQQDALARVAMAGHPASHTPGRVVRRGLAQFGGLLAAAGLALQAWAASAEVECGQLSEGWATEARRR